MEINEKYIVLKKGKMLTCKEKETILCILRENFNKFNFIDQAISGKIVNSLQIKWDKYYFLIYLLNDKIIAFLAYKFKCKFLKIDKFFCSIHYQNHNIGTLLLEKLIDLYSYRYKIYLQVNKKNKAVKFYIKRGFYIRKSIKKRINKYTFDDYIMCYEDIRIWRNKNAKA